MKTVMCMRKNAKNMKMRSQNSYRKIEETEFLVAGFSKVNCTKLWWTSLINDCIKFSISQTVYAAAKTTNQTTNLKFRINCKIPFSGFLNVLERKICLVVSKLRYN